jgi:hypothetical protein
LFTSIFFSTKMKNNLYKRKVQSKKKKSLKKTTTTDIKKYIKFAVKEISGFFDDANLFLPPTATITMFAFWFVKYKNTEIKINEPNGKNEFSIKIFANNKNANVHSQKLQ